MRLKTTKRTETVKGEAEVSIFPDSDELSGTSRPQIIIKKKRIPALIEALERVYRGDCSDCEV
jgi:hypothetical protein